MIRFIYIFPVILFFSCTSLAYEKKIVEHYYLVGVDTRTHLSISLKLETGDFIGRIEEVEKYATVGDSLIIAQATDNSNKVVYYVLNVKKDFDVAKMEDVVLGPMDSVSFAKRPESYVGGPYFRSVRNWSF